MNPNRALVESPASLKVGHGACGQFARSGCSFDLGGILTLQFGFKQTGTGFYKNPKP